jgi:hypothetical protein
MSNKKYISKDILLDNISDNYINRLFLNEYLITDDWSNRFLKNYQKLSKYNKSLNTNLDINLYLSNILVDLYKRPLFIIEYLKEKIILDKTDDLIAKYKEYIIYEISKK